MFMGTFAPWNESSRELSLPFSLRGTKIPGSEKTLNLLEVPIVNIHGAHSYWKQGTMGAAG